MAGRSWIRSQQCALRIEGQSGLAVGLGYAITDVWRVNAASRSVPPVNDHGVGAGASLTLD